MTEPSRAWLSIRGTEPELVWMVLVSAVVHLAAGITLFFLPRDLFRSTPPPVVAYTVKIVDPNALGGRLPKGPLRPNEAPEGSVDAAPRETKPPPEPEKKPEAKAEPKPEERPPPKVEPEEKTVTIPEKKPSPKAAKKPEEKKAPAKVAAQPTPKKPTAEQLARREREKRDRQIQEAVQRAAERGRGREAAGLGGTEEGKGAALGIGGEGGGGGVLAGLDFIIYKNQVEGIIKRNWTWMGANPNLTVRVGFRIQQDGEITDVRVVDRSGDATYDQSVIKAIRSSSPLPPPPEKYRDVFGNYLLDFVSGQLQSG